MPPYRFKLEPVRRLRQAQRDELRGQLADAYLAAQKLADEAKRIDGEIGEMVQLQQSLSGQSPLNLDRLLEAQRYEQVLKLQRVDLQQKAKLVEQEVQRRQHAVQVADQAVRVTDRLDELGREQHQQEVLRTEQKQLDEAASVLSLLRQSHHS